MAGSDAAAFEHLLTEDALDHMITSAARFIARTGPATLQDRWEEDAGLTPLDPGPGRGRAGRGRGSQPGTRGDVPARARRRLERLDRGVDLRPRDQAGAGSTASTATTSGSRRPTCWPVPRSPRRSRCATGRPTRPWCRPTRWSARTSSRSCASACARPMTRESSPRSPSPTRSCGRRRRAARSGIATTATATASTRMGARSTAPGSAGAGRSWSASAATTSSRRDATRDPTSRRCAAWRRPAACSRSRSGTPPRSRHAASSPAGRAARPCRWPGRTRST